jgi:hypothetical protein
MKNFIEFTWANSGIFGKIGFAISLAVMSILASFFLAATLVVLYHAPVGFTAFLLMIFSVFFLLYKGHIWERSKW